MNGPDHYTEAEGLLDAGRLAAINEDFPHAHSLFAAALIHAQLALTAATIDAAYDLSARSDQWSEVLR